ncbi:MAG TPA: BON domain-containing protein [Blastocatellia bacterium]|nr:BON domain-containing protein [Blastocatellia bacterium]
MNTDYQYVVGHLQTALATDPRVNMLDVKVMVTNNKIHLTGHVSSENRRLAVEEVVMELFPNLEIKNELTMFEVAQPAKPEVISD